MSTSTARYEIRSDRYSVEFWADTRLPFQPMGAVKQARVTLREALRSLLAVEGSWLAAEYVSAVTDAVDVENVLFYNVGAGVFSQLLTRGVTAQRRRKKPRRSPSGVQYRHFQRYNIEQVRSATRSDTVLVFRSPRLHSTTKPHDVWWAASSGSFSGVTPLTGRFCLDIEVPKSAAGSLASGMKPLLDGVVSAMHPVEHVDELAVERLSDATGWERSEIIKRLERPAATLLGARTVLSSYRRFVKWDPADDLCDGFTLRPTRSDHLCRVSVRTSE